MGRIRRSEVSHCRCVRSFANLAGPRVFGQVRDTLPAHYIRSILDDGTLLREENGTNTTIAGDARFAIPDAATLDRLFGGIPAILDSRNGATGLIPECPGDGTLLREENGAIWVVYGGARFHVPDEPTLTNFLFRARLSFNSGMGAVDPISRRTAPNLTLLRELDGTTWVVLAGARFTSSIRPRTNVFTARVSRSSSGTARPNRSEPSRSTAPCFASSSAPFGRLRDRRASRCRTYRHSRAFSRARPFFRFGTARCRKRRARRSTGTLVREESSGVSIVYGGAVSNCQTSTHARDFTPAAQ